MPWSGPSCFEGTVLTTKHQMFNEIRSNSLAAIFAKKINKNKSKNTSYTAINVNVENR